jgi:hypothetical protein
MRRIARVLVLPIAAVLSLAMLAGSAGAAGSRLHPKSVTVTIRAVDQAGNPEQIMTGGYIGYGQNRVQGGLVSGANQLRVGRYAIAVEVPALASDGIDGPSTLIARNVTVKHNMTLTLSARHSVPVQVSLDGTLLSSVQGNVCASTGPDSYGVFQVLSDAVQGPPPLFIVPYRSKSLRFVYQATSTTVGGTEVNLAGSFSGLPAKPVASFTTARLAKVSLQVTAGAVRPWSGHAGYFLFSPGGQACGATQSIPDPSPVLDPSVTTEYFSPGTWHPTYLPINPDSGSVGDTLTDTYAAGRSYSDNFYGAAWGPDFFTPSTYGVAGTNVLGIQASASNLFDDPAAGISDPDARAVVSLISHGRTLARLHLRNLGGPVFRHVIHHSGWYTVAVTATRLKAHGVLLLSPQVTVRWRFYASPSQPGVQLPLSYTQYRVDGLTLDNQATPGERTTIAVSVAGPTGRPNSEHAWREVKVQASFNGGLTWQTLRLDRRGRDWTLNFREPVSGNVSLRSTVVSARGDSTVQTIYDAYSIG